MTPVLIVLNAGSSSLKFQVFEDPAARSRGSSSRACSKGWEARRTSSSR